MNLNSGNVGAETKRRKSSGRPDDSGPRPPGPAPRARHGRGRIMAERQRGGLVRERAPARGAPGAEGRRFDGARARARPHGSAAAGAPGWRAGASAPTLAAWPCWRIQARSWRFSCSTCERRSRSLGATRPSKGRGFRPPLESAEPFSWIRRASRSYPRRRKGEMASRAARCRSRSSTRTVSLRRSASFSSWRCSSFCRFRSLLIRACSLFLSLRTSLLLASAPGPESSTGAGGGARRVGFGNASRGEDKAATAAAVAVSWS